MILNFCGNIYLQMVNNADRLTAVSVIKFRKKKMNKDTSAKKSVGLARRTIFADIIYVH